VVPLRGTTWSLLFSAAQFSYRKSVPVEFASKGTIELGGSISFQSIEPVSNGNTGNSTTILSIAPFIGFFPVDGFEIGFNPLGITSMSSSGGPSVTQLMILLAPSYNFKTNGKEFPFIEGLVGYTSVSAGSSVSGLSWGGRAGVKVAVTDKGLLILGIQYLQITLNQSNASNRNGENEFSVSAGFTIWL
jgi:hypothetical protein